MSDNPYFRFSREDLREEIRVEREQREQLRQTIARLREEIRQLRPLTQGYFLVDGSPYSNEAFNQARIVDYYATRNPSKAAKALDKLTRLTDDPEYLVEAVRQPWRTETVKSVLESPEKALREAEISRLQRQVDDITEELKKKDEAWKRPPTPPTPSYMRIQFVKFWEIREDAVKNKSKTPRIRFEVRVTLTVPWDSIVEAERRGESWSVTRIKSKTANYADSLLYEAIQSWDSGNQINLGEYYSESAVNSTDGWEDLDPTESFIEVPTFVITKYRNGSYVTSWEWSGLRVSEENL